MITPQDALPVINRLNAANQPASYYQYKLKNVFVTSYDVNASGD